MNDYLLEILRCPKSGGKLELDEDKMELICKESKLAYPIVDGIPIMLLDEARELKEDTNEN
tara:strand:+ start:306 stop:488 length:183 start_codon:yes stop_codon:yes gene_type:complete